MGTLGKEDVTRAIEEDHVRFWQGFATQPAARVEAVGPVQWMTTGLPAPPLNAVLRSRADGMGPVRKAMDVLEDGGLPFSWHVWPDDTPDGLPAFLDQHGLEENGRSIGMAITGKAWESVREPHSSKVAVRPVEDDEAFEEWCRTVVDAYGLPPRVLPVTIEAHQPVWRQDARYQYFLAVDGSDGVAASQLFTGAGVAGLHAVAVRPGRRRRGLGRAVSLAALSAGRAKRLPFAVLHATPMAKPLYESLGFQALTHVTRYDAAV